MGDGPWIVVSSWSKFQHYTDRNPPWIKLYLELNSRDDWRSLTFAERGLLVSIWCEYARSNGLLRQSDVSSRCGASTRLQQLESLNHAGWIEIVDSKPSRVRASARSREAKAKSKRSSELSKPRSPAKRDAPELLNFPEYLETLH